MPIACKYVNRTSLVEIVRCYDHMLIHCISFFTSTVTASSSCRISSPIGSNFGDWIWLVITISLGCTKSNLHTTCSNICAKFKANGRQLTGSHPPSVSEPDPEETTLALTRMQKPRHYIISRIGYCQAQAKPKVHACRYSFKSDLGLSREEAWGSIPRFIPPFGNINQNFLGCIFMAIQFCRH